MSPNTTVAIRKIVRPITQDTVDIAVADAVSLAGGFESIISKGDKVVLKPNIFSPQMPPITTDPRTVAALVKVALAAGAGEVIVAEGRSISTAKYRKANNTTRACSEFIGMTAAVEAAGGRMVFLEEEEFIEVEIPDGIILKKVSIPKIIMDADVLINVPAMKIHSLTYVTLGIKNFHGIISDEDKLFGHSYRELPAKLTDFFRVRKPDMTVISGIVGLERDHAEEGTPVDMGLIIAGKDVVAVDAVTSAVMGFEPFEVDTTRLAHEYGLGVGDLDAIEVKGESIESVRRPFARPEIALDTELFPGLKVIAGDYCRSCEYYTRRGLDKLKDNGYFDGTNDLTVVIGKEPPVPEKLDGKVIMLGDCCLNSKSVRRLRDYLLLDGRLQVVYQCPPMQFRIRAVDMMGE